MPNRDFGGLIREHRQRLGLTPTRVAELIGRAPGTVRDWERGRTIPNESRILSSLGAVLGIPERELFEAAGMPVPEREHTMTIEESLATIAPRTPAPTDATAPSAEPGPTDEQPSLFGDELPEVPRRERRRHGRDEPTRTERPAPAPVPPAPRPIPIQGASPSYVEDPDQRLAYRMRGVFTLVGLAATFVVLVWAGANFLDALGGAWDAIFGGL